MKRYFLLLASSLFLCSCVEDTSSLKVSLINLESRVALLEKRMTKMENDTQELENKLSKTVVEKVLERQTIILSDVEELKKAQMKLQAQMDDFAFKNEAKEREEKLVQENLNTRVEALELKLKELEKALLEKQIIQPPAENKTLSENATLSESKGQTDNQTSQASPSPQKTSPTEELKKETKEAQAEERAKPQNGTLGKIPPSEEQEKAKGEAVTKPQASKPTQAKKAPVSVEVPKNLKEEDLFLRAYSLFQKGDYLSARAHWEEYLKRFPKGRWVGQSYYWIGETYFKEKEYESAILNYQRLIDLPDPNPFKPKAMLRQAEAFLKLNDKKAAEIVLKKLVRTFPGTPEAKEAHKLLKSL